MYTPKAVLATVLAIIAGAPALSLAQNSLMDQARALFEPIPEAPTSMEGVPMTPQLVALGKALYRQGLCRLPHRRKCWRRNVCTLWGGGETGRRLFAASR